MVFSKNQSLCKYMSSMSKCLNKREKPPELVEKDEDLPGGYPSTVNSLQMWESSYFIVYLIEQYWRLICFINILSSQML